MGCRRRGFVLVCFLCLVAHPAGALSPSEVAVVCNASVSDSGALADAYMALRGIPSSQKLSLGLSKTEWIDRAAYETTIAEPLRLWLGERPHVRCLVTMYGVPLKIVDHGVTPVEGESVRRLEKEIAALQESPVALRRAQAELTQAKRILDKNASVDSELMLVKRKGAPTSFWLANPLFVARQPQGQGEALMDVLLVSRLDGPDPASVRRIMVDAVAVEQVGLTGTAYFDARWEAPTATGLKGYGLYDRSIHRGAERLESMGFLKVVTDSTEALFPPGSCPNAALYCGWYSLGTYVDAFAWQRGAVGYHIASAEMATLKNSESTAWCVKMLQKGVAATLGPVGEPYVESFPFPEVFFGLLAQGRLTLVECYAASLPFLSWKMVLVGDPLYRPFYAKPRGRALP